jgi:hypothetical protein
MQLSPNRFHFRLLSACFALCFAAVIAAERSATDGAAAAFAEDQTNAVDAAEVLAFTHDIDGDGVEEQFVTLAGFTNGRRGNIWTIYSGNLPTSIIGEAQFPPNYVVSHASEPHKLPKGLYTYWPGDQQKGHLICYSVVEGKIVEKDIGEIEPLGRDKALFDSIFGVIGDGKTAFAFKSYQMRELKAMSARLMPPSVTKEQTKPLATSATHPEPRSSHRISAQGESPKAKPAQETAEPTSLTPWSVIVILIVAAIGLLWLLSKVRK